MSQNRRERFFKAFGIEDDGRKEPLMTREEYYKWCDERKCNYKYCSCPASREETVIVFFEFAAYHDVTYIYSFEDNTVYESRFYIGD